MSFIYQDDSLQNDPRWKKQEHEMNQGMNSYHMKNFKSPCNAPKGATISDGYVNPCGIDTDSMLRHGLIENPSLIQPEEIDTTSYHFNSMPKSYEQQCEFKDISCSNRPDFTFWQSTSASVKQQENIHIFDYQGVGTRNWGRKTDNFYKQLDDVKLRQLF